MTLAWSWGAISFARIAESSVPWFYSEKGLGGRLPHVPQNTELGAALAVMAPTALVAVYGPSSKPDQFPSPYSR